MDGKYPAELGEFERGRKDRVPEKRGKYRN